MGIGKRLKEARERAGFTQEELGKLVGVTGSAITNYEKETSHPKEQVMYALMDVLQIEPNFLFQDCVSLPSMKKSPSALDEESDDFVELKSIYNSLNDAGRAQLMVQARQIANYHEYQGSPLQSKRA